MQTKKIIITTIILIIGITLFNKCNAYTISIENTVAKKDKEFTVKVKMDEVTGIATGNIKFDNSKLEFVKSNTNELDAKADAGTVSWVYMNSKFMNNAVDENIEKKEYGTQELSFIFKVKNNGNSEMSFENLALVGIDGSEYSNSNINGDTKIKIKSSRNIVIYIIAIAIIILIIYFIIKKKK